MVFLCLLKGKLFHKLPVNPRLNTLCRVGDSHTTPFREKLSAVLFGSSEPLDTLILSYERKITLIQNPISQKFGLYKNKVFFRKNKKEFIMNAIATIAFDNLVKIHNQEVTTTSKIVADNFEKQHKDVLRKIDEIIAETPVEFNERNFTPIEIDVDLGLNRTRKDRAFEISKDGFMLLVMGFTGKKAMELKIRFIQAFNWAFEQLQKSTSKQRDVLVQACTKLSAGNMSISDVYLMVGKQFGYNDGIKSIPTQQLAEATAFVYEMIIRLQQQNHTNNQTETNEMWRIIGQLRHRAIQEEIIKLKIECGEFYQKLQSLQSLTGMMSDVFAYIDLKPTKEQRQSAYQKAVGGHQRNLTMHGFTG